MTRSHPADALDAASRHSDEAVEAMLEELSRLDGRVVYVPVRHHSPACARLVRRLVLELRPSVVLVEGPSDFNERLDELALPHRLPIAIYTYVRDADRRRGAFYPFCAFSPEWQALEAARETGAAARFIDLPWAAMPEGEEPSHRYADGSLGRGDYVRALCEELGVEDFNALWDHLFEVAPDLDPAEMLRRCHYFCYHLRAMGGPVSESDRLREAFMAEQIARALDEYSGHLLVVTGGYHSSALWDLSPVPSPRRGGETRPAAAARPVRERSEPVVLPSPSRGGDGGEVDSGIALTPFSYARLDALTGYEAGMPNPGFYHHVWAARADGRAVAHSTLLARAVSGLRGRGQRASTADLIAAETGARALAALRGHDEVWRLDLLDGIAGALVKEEREEGIDHPLLAAVHEVFRGEERGRLASGAQLPPLVRDVEAVLAEHGLEPGVKEAIHDLDLSSKPDLARSRVLHRLRVLGIPGFDRVDGTDLATGDDVRRVWERWRVRWTPEQEAACIEAAVYGASLLDASSARLRDAAAGVERDAKRAARLLLDGALMGAEADPSFRERLVAIIRSDASFVSVAGALGSLLNLYRYDEFLGTAGDASVGRVLAESFDRCLWLLEGLGGVSGVEEAVLGGVRSLVGACRACAGTAGIDRAALTGSLRRVGELDRQAPLLRGATHGALWALGAEDGAGLVGAMRSCADPARLGDYLTGLFALAREAAQRQGDLLLQIDGIMSGYDDDAFLEALPALRLAFSFFTPREKHHMAGTLLQALGAAPPGGEPLSLEIDVATAARAVALEAELLQMLARYGLRGGAR